MGRADRWEHAAQKRFAALLEGDEAFRVPGVVDELSSEHVLTTELAPGVPIDRAVALPQEERDYVGSQLLRLILRELFEFRFMQARAAAFERSVSNVRARVFDPPDIARRDRRTPTSPTSSTTRPRAASR